MSKKNRDKRKQNNNLPSLTNIDTLPPEKIKEAISLFNLSQAQKSAIRVDTYNSVMDLISNEVLDRFMNQNIDEVSTGALLNVLQTISSVKEKESKNVQQISEEPAIQINQQNVNISIPKESLLPRDSKEKVIDTIKQILALSNQQEETLEDENSEVIVDGTLV